MKKRTEMKAIRILKHEHQAILLVIGAVEKEGVHIEKTGEIHARTVREMADFFKVFVDRCHHAKEEKHLFVMLRARGMPIKSGLLPVLLREHRQGRRYARAIAKAVAGKRVPGAAAVRKAKMNLAS